MFVGLNQGFGELIGAERLQRDNDYAVDIVRQDIPHEVSPKLEALVDEFAGSRSPRPMFLIHDFHMIVPTLLTIMANAVVSVRPTFVQMWNEPPSLDRITEAQYVEGINLLYQHAKEVGYRGAIVAGGLGNIDRDNRAYYERVIPQLPRDIIIDFHRYSYKTQLDRLRPWPGFKQRVDEINWMLSVAGGRYIALTEGASYHNQPETLGPWDRVLDYYRTGKFPPADSQLTNEQILDYTVADLNLYRAMGVSLVVLYQENDGSEGLGYGYFTDGKGNLKPQRNAIRIHKGMSPL